MKKKLVILLLMLPCLVMGTTCDVIKDTQTTNERTLTCDTEKRSATTFSFSSEIIPVVPDIVVEEDTQPDVQRYNFDYTGAYQTFVAPVDGYYQLEVWGAQGGRGMMNGESRREGGLGGYSRGTIYLNEGQKLYIYVGGQGEDAKDKEKWSAQGGFNGGGNGGEDGSINEEEGKNASEPGSGGGGATHIATVSGYLSTFSNSNIDELLIVAGGGGGTTGKAKGGNAGGYIGVKATTGAVDACSGTQSSGYKMGHGQSGTYSKKYGYNTGVAGGGGGFYGGCAVNANGGSGSGGSGYIGNGDLKDKVMYCYNDCRESGSIATKTIITNKGSETAKSGYAKRGNGYARITYVNESDKENDNDNDIVNNSVCKITCEEEVIFSIDPIKKVLAGNGFSYPLYASGERKCTAVYNYQEYETKIKTLVNEYNSLTGTAKQKKANEITNYYAQKKSCDEFNTEGSEYYNEYSFNGDVSVKLEVSSNGYIKEEIIPYNFVNIEEYDSDIVLDEIYYAACNYNETGKKCRGDDSTIIGWTSTSRIFGKYTMNDVYLERYTGEVRKTYDNNTCTAGDVYFTDFTAKTRPEKNTNNDKGYKITLIADSIGNNLGVSSDKWKLNINCWYQVKNFFLPQGGPGKDEDLNYKEYGSTVFQYRIIDLNDPFPNREAGANWKGKENIIKDKNDKLSTLERFVITLSRSSIKQIREYNSTHKYDNYDFDEENKSNFIITYNEIIDRK